MKKQILTIALIVASATTFAQTQKAQRLQVVGDNSTTLNASAAVQIDATTRGFLPPRMTTTQRDAITSPATGLTIYNTETNSLEWFDGSSWYSLRGNITNALNTGTYSTDYVGTKADVVDVLSLSGKTWMDRNLGAGRVAQSATDAQAYGDLFQWGRFADGHQSRTSTVITTKTDLKTVSNWINQASDWRTTPSNDLWTGLNAVNNPCPTGYRLPTSAEFTLEFSSNSITNSTSAASSALKLTMAGIRSFSGTAPTELGTNVAYWTSTFSGANATSFYINDAANPKFGPYVTVRSNGFSVRCIKGN